jgi:hypothetical protein
MSYPERQILSTSVVVVNVKIGFWRVVALFVKCFLAVIPAIIITALLFAIVAASIFGALTTLGFHPEHVHPWLTQQFHPEAPVPPR